MRLWDKRILFCCAALLLLAAFGHTVNYTATSHNIAANGVDGQIGDAIRDVWLTISGMLTFFGLLLFRELWFKTVNDWILILAIGCLLTDSGVTGLIVSAGKPFWLQQLGIGLVIAIIGWRARLQSTASSFESEGKTYAKEERHS